MSKKKKISASDYYSLPTIRKWRRLTRTQARKHRIALNKGCWKKLKNCMQVRIKYPDNNGGNILKTLRYKGRIII